MTTKQEFAALKEHCGELVDPLVLESIEECLLHASLEPLNFLYFVISLLIFEEV